MSLFDVIKYPISTPPTEQELAALPAELFDDWKDQVEFGADYTPNDFAHWYTLGIISSDLKHIDLLRQMIKDYDNL